MLQTKIQNGHVDLRFDAGADSVDAPSPGVVVVEVHPAEPDARVPLPCAVEEAVVDGDPDAAVLDVGAAAPDEHGLVVRGEVAPRDRHVRAAVGDVDEAVGEVAQGAAVDPDVPGPGLDLHRVGVVAAAARDLQPTQDHVLALPELQPPAGEPHAPPAAVDGLVGRHAHAARGEADGAGHVEDDPQRLGPPASLPERAQPVVCRVDRFVWQCGVAWRLTL